MTPPILVLDFDGVMNDTAFLRAVNDRYTATQIYASPELHLDPVRVARVQRVCDATGAEVVLVTAWQASFGPRQLKAILQRAGLTTKVRRTVHGLKMSGDCRADCTRAYLANVGATRFVVLDDTTVPTLAWPKAWGGKGRPDWRIGLAEPPPPEVYDRDLPAYDGHPLKRDRAMIEWCALKLKAGAAVYSLGLFASWCPRYAAGRGGTRYTMDLAKGKGFRTQEYVCPVELGSKGER